MTELALLLVVLMMLACAVAMGGMIVMAWRGMRHRRTAGQCWQVSTLG
jgi:hypothetical protein